MLNVHCDLKTRGIFVNGRSGSARQGQVQDCPHQGIRREGKKYQWSITAFDLLHFAVLCFKTTFTLAGEAESRTDWKHCEGEQGEIWTNENHPVAPLQSPASILKSLDSEFVFTFCQQIFTLPTFSFLSKVRRVIRSQRLHYISSVFLKIRMRLSSFWCS